MSEKCPKCGLPVFNGTPCEPDHGSCCTCQECGCVYDDCICHVVDGEECLAARVELLEKALDSMAMAFANHQRMYDACPAGGILDRAKEHKAWHLAVAKGENPVAAIDAARGTE